VPSVSHNESICILRQGCRPIFKPGQLTAQPPAKWLEAVACAPPTHTAVRLTDGPYTPSPVTRGPHIAVAIAPPTRIAVHHYMVAHL